MYDTNLIIVITHCPVCGKRHTPPVHVYDDGDTEGQMVSETCEECWTWFRLEEFSITVRSGSAWAPEVAHV